MKKIFLTLLFLSALSCSRPATEPEEEYATPAAEAEKTSVEMGAEAQSHIGLEVVTAEVRMLKEFLPVTGTVQPIDSRVSHIRPLAAGRLTSVSVRVGDRVAPNQTLAMFDNLEAVDVISQYRAARADLEKLNVQLAVARQQTERNRQLAVIGAVPRKEYELSQGEEKSLVASVQAEESLIAGLSEKLARYGLSSDAAASSTSSAIRAPFGGVVIAANASPGETINPDSELFQIADISQVWVQAEVYEKDLGRIQQGGSASIRVDTYPNREFIGRVAYISDILDPRTRTARIRCELPNRDASLKLDMFATVLLPTTFNREALVIPAESIQQIGGVDIVFVRTGPTTFERKTVQIGRIVQGTAEVLGGLNGGEAVVTKGAFHLKSIVLGEEIGEEH
jgi:cobalt-zinc-cadmium efflux system membrane fusion protein